MDVEIDSIPENFRAILSELRNLSEDNFFVFKYVYGNLKECADLLKLLVSNNRDDIKRTATVIKLDFQEYLRFLILKSFQHPQ